MTKTCDMLAKEHYQKLLRTILGSSGSAIVDMLLFTTPFPFDVFLFFSPPPSLSLSLSLPRTFELSRSLCPSSSSQDLRLFLPSSRVLPAMAINPTPKQKEVEFLKKSNFFGCWSPWWQNVQSISLCSVYSSRSLCVLFIPVDLPVFCLFQSISLCSVYFSRSLCSVYSSRCLGVLFISVDLSVFCLFQSISLCSVYFSRSLCVLFISVDLSVFCLFQSLLQNKFFIPRQVNIHQDVTYVYNVLRRSQPGWAA